MSTDKTPVRRTARARKINSRFVGDDIDEGYRKLVTRITASNQEKLSGSSLNSNKNESTPSKESEKSLNSKKNESRIFLSDIKAGTNDASEPIFLSDIKPGTREVSKSKEIKGSKKKTLKRIKLQKKEDNDEKILNEGSKIIRWRSSTESDSEESHDCFSSAHRSDNVKLDKSNLQDALSDAMVSFSGKVVDAKVQPSLPSDSNILEGISAKINLKAVVLKGKSIKVANQTKNNSLPVKESNCPFSSDEDDIPLTNLIKKTEKIATGKGNFINSNEVPLKNLVSKNCGGSNSVKKSSKTAGSNIKDISKLKECNVLITKSPSVKKQLDIVPHKAKISKKTQCRNKLKRVFSDKTQFKSKYRKPSFSGTSKEKIFQRNKVSFKKSENVSNKNLAKGTHLVSLSSLVLEIPDSANNSVSAHKVKNILPKSKAKFGNTPNSVKVEKNRPKSSKVEGAMCPPSTKKSVHAPNKKRKSDVDIDIPASKHMKVECVKKTDKGNSNENSSTAKSELYVVESNSVSYVVEASLSLSENPSNQEMNKELTPRHKSAITAPQTSKKICAKLSLRNVDNNTKKEITRNEQAKNSSVCESSTTSKQENNAVGGKKVLEKDTPSESSKQIIDSQISMTKKLDVLDSKLVFSKTEFELSKKNVIAKSESVVQPQNDYWVITKGQCSEKDISVCKENATSRSDLKSQLKNGSEIISKQGNANKEDNNEVQNEKLHNMSVTGAENTELKEIDVQQKKNFGKEEIPSSIMNVEICTPLNTGTLSTCDIKKLNISDYTKSKENSKNKIDLQISAGISQNLNYKSEENKSTLDVSDINKMEEASRPNRNLKIVEKKTNLEDSDENKKLQCIDKTINPDVSDKKGSSDNKELKLKLDDNDQKPKSEGNELIIKSIDNDQQLNLDDHNLKSDDNDQKPKSDGNELIIKSIDYDQQLNLDDNNLKSDDNDQKPKSDGNIDPKLNLDDNNDQKLKSDHNNSQKQKSDDSDQKLKSGFTELKQNLDDKNPNLKSNETQLTLKSDNNDQKKKLNETQLTLKSDDNDQKKKSNEKELKQNSDYKKRNSESHDRRSQNHDYHKSRDSSRDRHKHRSSRWDVDYKRDKRYSDYRHSRSHHSQSKSRHDYKHRERSPDRWDRRHSTHGSYESRRNRSPMRTYNKSSTERNAEMMGNQKMENKESLMKFDDQVVSNIAKEPEKFVGKVSPNPEDYGQHKLQSEDKIATAEIPSADSPIKELSLEKSDHENKFIISAQDQGIIMGENFFKEDDFVRSPKNESHHDSLSSNGKQPTADEKCETMQFSNTKIDQISLVTEKDVVLHERKKEADIYSKKHSESQSLVKGDQDFSIKDEDKFDISLWPKSLDETMTMLDIPLPPKLEKTECISQFPLIPKDVKLVPDSTFPFSCNEQKVELPPTRRFLLPTPRLPLLPTPTFSPHQNLCIEDPFKKSTDVKLGAEDEIPTIEMDVEEIQTVEMDDISFDKIELSEEMKPEQSESKTNKKEISPEEKKRKNREIVEHRLKSFIHLNENCYVNEKNRIKSKEVRRMVCDCSLSKDELKNGDKGCGDDCLNRLLMIECGSRCPLGDRCMNKLFQNKSYSNVEVFNTEEKGCGICATEDINAGSFIMEYIGEVFGSKEFRRRRREYAKESSAHFYFMALRADSVIDATRQGNISRFINHSCDPNAETQKWTVNGELRIGFFATNNILAGEEINFDYRLERYGREPQKCYCGTAICRGWLGESPDEKTKEEIEEGKKKQLRDKKKREEKQALFDNIDVEDEIEKLTLRGLRNKQDTLELSRLMVRAEEGSSRLSLLRLLYEAEKACKRLFLDYHGLKLLWSWMVDLGLSNEYFTLKFQVLQILERLPITNRTQLTDSKVLFIVERWSKQVHSSPESESLSPEETHPADQEGISPATKSSMDMSEKANADLGNQSSTPDDSSQDSESSTTKKGTNRTGFNFLSNLLKEASRGLQSRESPPEVKPPADDELEISTTAVQEMTSPVDNTGAKDSPPNQKVSSPVKLSAGEVEPEKAKDSVVVLAEKLLTDWSSLSEAFRIPKKERIEIMKEHEREVEKGFREYLNREGNDINSYYGNWNRRDSDKRDRKRRRVRNRDWDRERKRIEISEDSGLSKEERRERFALQAARDEEESRQRKSLQESVWKLHLGRCTALNRNPSLTPIFDGSGQFFWQPLTGSWQPFAGEWESLPVPALYGAICGEEQSSPSLFPDSLFVSGVSPEYVESFVHGIPLPGEVTPSSYEISPTDGRSVKPPIIPPHQLSITVPSHWRMSRTDEGVIYFYHRKTRTSQWQVPTHESHSELLKRFGIETDSDFDSDGSSTTTDSDSFSSEEEVDGELISSVVCSNDGSDEKMIRRHRGKRKRSEKLVQERIISPVRVVDRAAARKERRVEKERAQNEVRMERLDAAYDILNLPNTHAEASPDSEDEGDILMKLAKKHKGSGKKACRYKSKERADTALADHSGNARKIRDYFRSRIARFIVIVLNPYRKKNCKAGRIACTADFKYLARKLTHFVMVKELKQLPSIDKLVCNDSVQNKTRDFVHKYMSKYGSNFQRDPNDKREY